MPSYRGARTQEDVSREISAIIREMKDPRIANSMVSVVKTDLSSDLSYCKIYISSLMGTEGTENAVKALKNAAGFMRKELGSRLKLRHTPELHFFADGSIEHSAHIAKLLNNLEVKSDED